MKNNYSEKYGKLNENLLIEWTCPYGPEKGQRIQAWFHSEDPEVKELIDNCEGIIIDRT